MRRDVEIAVFEYVNSFYNPRRGHSSLDGKSPVAFEKIAASQEKDTGTEAVQVHSSLGSIRSRHADHLAPNRHDLLP